jgi:hypothetical protein
MTVLYTELSPDVRQKCHMAREGIEINVHGKPKRESITQFPSRVALYVAATDGRRPDL